MERVASGKKRRHPSGAPPFLWFVDTSFITHQESNQRRDVGHAQLAVLVHIASDVIAVVAALAGVLLNHGEFFPYFHGRSERALRRGERAIELFMLKAYLATRMINIHTAISIVAPTSGV